jgi:hypothetical protein
VNDRSDESPSVEESRQEDHRHVAAGEVAARIEESNNGYSRRRKIVALLSVLGPRCPLCHGILVRSRLRRFERFWALLSDRRPHRCERCLWRGWGYQAPHDDAAIKHVERILADLFEKNEESHATGIH